MVGSSSGLPFWPHVQQDMLGRLRCRSAESGGVLGRQGEVGVVGVRISFVGLGDEAWYMETRCFTLALSTCMLFWMASNCRLWSSIFPMSPRILETSSRSLDTWSLSRACFWSSALAWTASVSAWICLKAWSVWPTSALFASSSWRPWNWRLRWSTLRASARPSNSVPMSRIWRSTCSRFAWSAFMAQAPATRSILLERSSSFVASARRESSLARLLTRSLMWSAISASTFLARASFKICTCLATCSARGAEAFCETSWLSAWMFLAT
mmetsp:Transcript_7540/g.23837  ORF Transcript_7540/g.23837 Transcript_7540/m.23837 type:complete len:268 (-) Transcript_7540:469-1272(-)